MQLIDIGANLTHESFSADLDVVLQRAADVEVTQMVVTGSSVNESRAALRLAKAHPGRLFATAGIHPHEAKTFDTTTVPALRELAHEKQVVCIGECGLDFNRDYSPRDAQRSCLEAHLELAVELNMPVFLHERDAADAMIHVLKEFRSRLPRAVIHCFTGDRSALVRYLDLDMHIGITGWICDERRGRHLHDIVPLIPPNRLMIESDAPYLLPRTILPRPKSRRNEPSYLPHVLATLAACLGQPETQLAEQTTHTAKRFFELP